MSKSAARITAIGSYVPEKRLTNLDLEQLVDTNDEWILQRTGIKERRVAGEHEFTSDISVKAAQDLAERYGKSFDDVDLIIVCTMTPDFKTPSVAAMVQAKLNIPNAGAIDLNAACAGFSYGLQMANGLITSELHKKILVIDILATQRLERCPFHLSIYFPRYLFSFISSVRSSYSHPNLLLTQQHHPTFSDHTGPR